MSSTQPVPAQDKRVFTAKDAIQIGIYTALYAVCAMLFGSIGFLAVLYPFAPFAIALFGGPVFVLFYTKVHHFGMITIMGSLLSIFMAITGHGLYVLICGILGSLLSDYICSIGHYRSFRTMMLGYAVFSLIMATTYFPMIFAAEEFYKMVHDTMSPEYAAQLQKVMTKGAFVVTFIGAFAGGLLGALLGKFVLKKHFRRAGIAG